MDYFRMQNGVLLLARYKTTSLAAVFRYGKNPSEYFGNIRWFYLAAEFNPAYVHMRQNVLCMRSNIANFIYVYKVFLYNPPGYYN